MFQSTAPALEPGAPSSAWRYFLEVEQQSRVLSGLQEHISPNIGTALPSPRTHLGGILIVIIIIIIIITETTSMMKNINNK